MICHHPPHCRFTLLPLTALLICHFSLRPRADFSDGEDGEREGWMRRGLEMVNSGAPVSGVSSFQRVVRGIVHLSLHELKG